MAQYIDKSPVVVEIKRRIKALHSTLNEIETAVKFELKDFLSFLDTIEVKTDEDNSLEKFKSLQHISGNLHQTLEDWGYAPNLYFFDRMWHVSWISCEEGDGIKDFEGNTPEEAIDKAYDWFHSTFCNS